jgi:tetratricopeptide (TPR) repeat protein
MYEGKLTEASSELGSAVAMLEESGHREYLELAMAYSADLDLLMGNARKAVDTLEGLVTDSNWDDVWPGCIPTLVRAWLAFGGLRRVEAASDLIDRTVERAREVAGSLAEALWAQGLVRVRQGRLEEACAAFTEGLSLARDQSLVYLEARMLDAQADIHDAEGEAAEGEARRREALAIFDCLGARFDAQRARARVQGWSGENPS